MRAEADSIFLPFQQPSPSIRLTARIYVRYTSAMLKRVSIFLDTDHSKKLAAIGKRKGLKVSQLIRLAISEFIARESVKP